MARKTILIAHPFLSAVGGGNAVATWAIQALIRDYDVAVATLGPIDTPALNRAFGTSLAPKDFQVAIAPRKYLRRLSFVPTRGALLESHLTIAWARELDRRNRYDVLFSTQNEADFGRPGLQYIHYPGWYLPRPAHELQWFHRIPGLLALYRRYCFRISHATQQGIEANISLANSTFVAGRTRDAHRCEPVILYPPVPGNFPDVPWEQRRPAIVGIGRLDPLKRWGMAVEIVNAVRARGHEMALTLIGQPDSRDEERRLRRMAESRPWLRILTNLSREELAGEVASHRYGVHAMIDEHFGIAPAELQRAGCVTFVHRSGGPVEIVGHDPRLTFDSVADAAEKIVRAIEDPETGGELRALVASRRDCFSSDRFCRELRLQVAAFTARS